MGKQPPPQNHHSQLSLGGGLLSENEVEEAAKVASEAAMEGSQAPQGREERVQRPEPTQSSTKPPERPQTSAEDFPGRTPLRPSKSTGRTPVKAPEPLPDMSWWLGDVATTREALRERLVKGQKNLTLGVERLSGMKDAGIGSDFEKEFLEWFEKWIRFEQQARIVGLEGCIHGDEERCPQDVAVRCESCGYGREEVKAKDGVRVGFIYHDTIRWVLLKPNLRVRDHKYRTRPGWATERSHIELLKEKAQGGAGLVRLKTDAGVFESSLQLWLEKASPPPGPESDQLMLDDRYWVEVQDVDGGV